jgi:flagellin
MRRQGKKDQMSNSINTNVGAMVALSALRISQSNLSNESKVVQAGYRVADALDNASTFSVAQGIRGNLQAFRAVQASLANGLSLAEVTRAALERMTDVVNNIRTKAIQLADPSVDGAARTIYWIDFGQVADQIPRYINQANFNGVNLLSAGSTTRTFLADASANQLSLTGQSSVWTAWTTFQANVNVNDAALAAGSLGVVDTLGRAITTAMAAVAGEARQLRLQVGYVNDITDANTAGLGAIVDGDIGKAAAAVQAEQVRQQLYVNAVSIANAQPSAMLGFLR